MTFDLKTGGLILLLGVVLGAVGVHTDAGIWMHGFVGSHPDVGACTLHGVRLILSPGATDALVGAIDGAQRTVDVGLFEFSASPLKAALKRAHDRGVRVRVILDAGVSQNQLAAEFLALEGMDVKWAPARYNYFHQKAMVIDGRTLVLGSMNWSNSALNKNREANVRIESIVLAREWLASFEKDWEEGFTVTQPISAGV